MKYDEKLLPSRHYPEIELGDLKAGELFVCEEIDCCETLLMKVSDREQWSEETTGYPIYDAIELTTGYLFALGDETDVIPIKKVKLVSK
jgi:hypothetical protein